MSDDENTVLPSQDPQAYRRPIVGTFRFGALPTDKEIKASPYLIKVLREREWIEK